MERGSNEALKSILQGDGVSLYTRTSRTNNEEAFVKGYLESKNCFLSVVESGWCHFGVKSAVYETKESIYLSHKPTGKNFRIDGNVVNTSSMSWPRHELISIKENGETITISWKRGEETFEKSFEVKTEPETQVITEKTFLKEK